jgi:DNA-binding FadR family transcriptional regulator
MLSSFVTSHGGQSVIFSALDSANPAQAVASRIQSAISLGILADGQALPPEPEMATNFAITPFALREGLKLLRDEGLLETRRGRNGGSFIRLREGGQNAAATQRLKSLSAVDVREIGDWRLTLMTGTALLAVERASKQQISQLHELVGRLEHSETLQISRRAHSRFHLELVASSQSVKLHLAEISFQTDHGWLLGSVVDRVPYRTKAAQNFESLVDAIGRRDTRAAMEAAKNHCDYFTRYLLQVRLAADGDWK